MLSKKLTWLEVPKALPLVQEPALPDLPDPTAKTQATLKPIPLSLLKVKLLFHGTVITFCSQVSAEEIVYSAVYI